MAEHVSAAQQSVQNRLAGEKSPYLLQHAANPVDWYPWGAEAFHRAKEQDKPIFLSIGYATCHWCHVMAHESFEDEQVAGLLNQHFVSIKVDREERPDVDKIYMDVCQALTGRGGWPLSVFLTPEGKPFYAGTYFPRTTRMGMPGLVDLLRQIAEIWRKDRGRIEASSGEITRAIQPSSEPTDIQAFRPEIGLTWLKKGYGELERTFDSKFGGFGAAPKFPTPHHLTFLLRWFKRTGDATSLTMAEKTLEGMRNGGLFDQIGFGFHRYSVDDRWLVPHFEKMLYDQALLAIASLEVHQVTGKEAFAHIAQDIFTYVLRDMTAPEGGFYCAEDADSEGKEGLFYVWTPAEVKKHLGEKTGEIFCHYYDITEAGNFEEGRSIPHVRMPVQTFAARKGLDAKEVEDLLNSSRRQLFEARKQRVRPLKDDKVLTSWNGLMVAALAKGYQVLGNPDYRLGAERAVRFVLEHLRRDDGRLLRRYRDGEAAYPAYLDDYAFFVWGLLDLYESTFESAHLETAVSLTDQMVRLFWDKELGGLFFAGEGNEPLIARSKDVYDGALPSGNSVAVLNFLRLARMTGKTDYEKKVEDLIVTFAKSIEEYPAGHTQFLNAIDFAVGPSREIVICGDPAREYVRTMISLVQERFLPNKVLLVRPPGPEGETLVRLAPFVEHMASVHGLPTAYVCEGFTCQAPTTDSNALSLLLN
jgi:uncharacterized protein YyaL (SSP411 family)